MAETLEQVKRQFGPEAVILNTKTSGKARLLGVRERPYVEITAARRMSDLPEPLRSGTVPLRSRRTYRADGAATTLSPASKQIEDKPTAALEARVGELTSLVSELVHDARQTRATEANLPGALYDTYLTLVQNAVADDLARKIMERVRSELSADRFHDPAAVRRQLAGVVESMLPMAGPIRLAASGGPTVVALVGPTGVGKTTTVAKLAANFSLRQRRKVGLITIDTYRIAAVEQLKTYAEIIDVPLDVVMSPKELDDAVTRMQDRDIVLIDTAGRSQRDTARVNELAEFFEQVRPHEVHLVLSGTCGAGVLMEAVQRFGRVGIDRVIFTKLDEAVGFGVLISCLEKANASLSYVTTGQDVPEDIRLGERKALARLITQDRASAAAPRRQEHGGASGGRAATRGSVA